MLRDLNAHSHRRFNPLTREWILVSPHRTDRPWQGQIEPSAASAPPEYDPACYMCPGNVRATGARNPAYPATFVFDNDYPALRPENAQDREDAQGLFVARSESGICRVVCFSPRHDLTIARMKIPEIQGVVNVWAEQYSQLGADPSIAYVQVFENRGALMGASNPHPHCQIWATSSLPNEPAKELAAQKEYLAVHEKCLLCAYLEQEHSQGERMVVQNSHFSAIVPFWAIWPFETMVIPSRHVGMMAELTPEEREGLADILKRLTTGYDRIFDVPFPYTMGFHQSPTDGQPNSAWHLHGHFYPPLLRSPAIRKFMVGFEMLGMPQRDITAESAAERLRSKIGS